jgi:tripartite-type tricarboxylate transporter receptor subunit TctC
MIEAGIKDFDVSIWIGLMAPHGSPEVAIARLNKEVARALQAPEVASRLRSEGYEPVGSTPDEMTASIKIESATWARVIRAAGIKAD